MSNHEKEAVPYVNADGEIVISSQVVLVDSLGKEQLTPTGQVLPRLLAKRLGFKSIRGLIEANQVLANADTTAFFESLRILSQSEPATINEFQHYQANLTHSLATIDSHFFETEIPSFSLIGIFLDRLILVGTSPPTECGCPCPSGIKLDAEVNWDIFGPANIGLFDGTMKGGDQTGTKVSENGEQETQVNFGNDDLLVNNMDIEIQFEMETFFNGVFDEDECCVSATGSFDGVASVVQGDIAGSSNVSESVSIGGCKGTLCCVATYVGIFRNTFDIDVGITSVSANLIGWVRLTVSVWRQE